MEPRADVDKQTLHRYLRKERDALLAKLDGLDEYAIRRPLTPTGTNLLGLAKHVASVQLGYFSETFGRPSGRPLPWEGEGAEPDADMWATAGETREEIVEFYRFSCAHADATIDGLPLDAPGSVAWWPPEHRQVTLHQILVHVIAETARHAGHADILSEELGGGLGNGPADPNVPGRSADEWAAYRARIEAAAVAASAAARAAQ